MKPNFLNFRIKHEMPFYQRIIWRVLGKKHFGIDEESGLSVTAYEFRNITLIWELK